MWSRWSTRTSTSPSGMWVARTRCDRPSLPRLLKQAVWHARAHSLPPDHLTRMHARRVPLQIRALWRHYYQDSDAVIFVVDSSDRARLAEARETLQAMLAEVGCGCVRMGRNPLQRTCRCGWLLGLARCCHLLPAVVLAGMQLGPSHLFPKT
jgi:hypothetical protein